jgi:hypothetical protein
LVFLELSDRLKKLNPVDMNGTMRPTCLPGTRQRILDDIREWASVSSNGNVLWLSGVAGSGKSTISTTVSLSFQGLDRLGAFLFFDRNDASQSNPAAVIRTIAYYLALVDPHIGAAMSAIIDRNPTVMNAPMPTQFKQLLLDPLQAAAQYIHGPILIILDALDECGNRDSRATLIHLLANEAPKLPPIFRVFITSRREPDITDKFKSRVVEMKLDTGPDGPSNTKDVNIFLRHELSQIQENSSLGLTWPGEKEIQALVELSGGLFIWAATAIRFLDGYRPDEQLQILMARDSTQGFTLDALYDVALQASAPWTINPKFSQDARAVLACIVLGREPMTDETIDKLLSDNIRSADVLKYLGCVIQWRSHGDHARTLHASFTDYITDPSRSGGQPWAIDPKVDHHSLSLACLRILNLELKFNICGLEDSHRRNADVVDISERVTKSISPHLSYSSCHLFSHVGGTPIDKGILRGIDFFLRNKLLYWLEVLSVLGRVPVATVALRDAAHYVQVICDCLVWSTFKD